MRLYHEARVKLFTTLRMSVRGCRIILAFGAGVLLAPLSGRLDLPLNDREQLAPSVLRDFAFFLHAQSTNSMPSLNPIHDSTEIKTARCATCRIILEPRGRVESSNGHAVLVPYASLAITRTGDILVGAPHAGEVYKFAPSGRFEAVLNRTGKDAGELLHVTGLAVGPGDTIYAMDNVSRWMNRLTPSGKFIDRTLLPGGIYNWIPLGARRLFVSATIPTRAAVGFPLHVLDTLGLIASFGQEESVSGPRARGGLLRYLAPANDGTIWVANRLSYRIESWTRGGKLVKVLTRRLSWFPPLKSPPEAPPQTRLPPSRIVGLHDENDGFLWIYMLVADKDWKPEQLVPSTVPGMLAPQSPILDPFFDTMIEVIDLKRNVVIDSFRDSRMLVPIAGGYLASYEQDVNGNSAYRVWRPRLINVTRLQPLP